MFKPPAAKRHNFAALAEAFPTLKPYLFYQRRSGEFTINFKDARALRELTAAILYHDYRIRLEVPLDTLLPMVTNRNDYILWIEHLVELGRDRKEKVEIYGIDIGTGASCIYPLLGCMRNKNWNFLALEINERSADYARENVRRNNLSDRITIFINTDNTPILPRKLIDSTGRKYEFVMCNPPFYKDEEQIKSLRSFKVDEPSAVCTGSRNEMITDGGEVAFIRQILDESKALGSRVGVYTSLVGRLEDLRLLKRILLEEPQVHDVSTAEFRYARTTRWGISWRIIQK